MTGAAYHDAGHLSEMTGNPVACFHCGLPLGTQTWRVVVDGTSRDTCCAGCQAVAGLIAGQGLGAYYRNRNAFAPTVANTAAATKFLEFDLPQVQAGYVCRVDTNQAEAALLIEGVTCAACLWLIEQRLLQIDGVTAATINYGANRLRVRWQSSRIKLSAILAAIMALGYHASLYDRGRSESLLAQERRTLLWRLFVAAFGMMQVMMYAFPAYVAGDDMPADIERLMQWAGLVLTLPVMVWSAVPFYRGAWQGLKARSLNRDLPVSIGLVTAFAASVLTTAGGAGAVYYDSVCMFTFLLLGTRFLELNARTLAAREQDRLARLVPAMATRLPQYPESQIREEIPAVALREGQFVEIKPGAPVPVDGVIVDGASSVNEALLTGEPKPLAKQAGDSVIAGSVNGTGALIVRIDRTGEHTTVAAIVRLMDRALAAKPRVASLADHAASHFVFALLLVTAASAATWWFIDRERALPVVIALLVVTCPCALSLATPVALIAATGNLSRQGILITRGHALEALDKATYFVFDKTGTLTTGRMSLIGVLVVGTQSREDLIAMAASLEGASEHPVGRALVAAGRKCAKLPASELQYITGKGVEGTIAGKRMRIGSPAFVAELSGAPAPMELTFVSDDVTTVALGSEGEWLALFTLGDSVRPDAKPVIESLSAQGATVHLLSGDRMPCVSRLAARLDIPFFAGNATPQDKLDYLRKLQAQGAVVAAVGDGVNDAPLLAQAQVSVAMAAGTELARLNADVTLLTDHIAPLLKAVDLSRRTLRIIHQNFLWAIAYNVIAVPLAVMGLVTPLVAAIGMSVSSLLVIGNALRLCGSPPRVAGRA